MYRRPMSTVSSGLMDWQFCTNEFSRESKISFKVNQHKNIIFDFTVKEIIQMGVIGGYSLKNEKEVAKKIQHIQLDTGTLLILKLTK